LRIFRRLIQCLGDVLQLHPLYSAGRRVAQHEHTRPGAEGGGDIVAAVAGLGPSRRSSRGPPGYPPAGGRRAAGSRVSDRPGPVPGPRSGCARRGGLAPVQYSGPPPHGSSVPR
jgi:hypothetical protein